jgi:hypothetical protein
MKPAREVRQIVQLSQLSQTRSAGARRATLLKESSIEEIKSIDCVGDAQLKP